MRLTYHYCKDVVGRDETNVAMVAIKFSVIAAKFADNNGIGINGQLPWHLPSEMAHFYRVTTNTTHTRQDGKEGSKSPLNVVIMGRKTWESIPQKNRPLRNRISLIISSSLQSTGEAAVYPSLNAALAGIECQNLGHIFVIGGARLYQAALDHPDCETIYITDVTSPAHATDLSKSCDTFFPEIPVGFILQQEENSIGPEKENEFELCAQIWKRYR